MKNRMLEIKKPLLQIKNLVLGVLKSWALEKKTAPCEWNVS
jgi:hypothetical protein